MNGITFFATRALDEVARAPLRENVRYQFFAGDPEGRTVEVRQLTPRCTRQEVRSNRAENWERRTISR